MKTSRLGGEDAEVDAELDVTVDDQRLRVGEGTPSGGVHSRAGVVALEGSTDVFQ